MTAKPKKIGTLGCAMITPVALINPAKEIDFISVHAVAGRDPEKAREYALKHGIPNVFETYEEVLECPEIDFVYIPLSNHLHKKWVIKAAEAKKHILVEKPIALNCAELMEMEEACSKNGVHILEAIMVQFHPWQQAIKEIISDERYGKLKRINTQIVFESQDNFGDNYRTRPELGGGAFYDVGSYWLQFIQYLLGLNPVSFGGKSAFNGPNGCDWTFEAFMEFDNGVRSDFICSFEMPSNTFHTLEFEKASIKVKDFFRAKFGNVKIPIEIVHHETGEKEKLNVPAQNYYVNQLKFFSDVIDGVRENLPKSETYERMKMMEDIYRLARNS